MDGLYSDIGERMIGDIDFLVKEEKRLNLEKNEFMETIQIELKNKNALSILKSLEKANMIKMLQPLKTIKDSPVHFKGAISPDRAIELAAEIEKSRTEWDERTI